MKILKLSGMKDRPTDLPGWSRTWKLTGPVESKEQQPFEGYIRSAGLHISSKKIPQVLEINGISYHIRKVSSPEGIVDFSVIAGIRGNKTAFYMFTDFIEEKRKKIPFSFGAEQSTVFWLNGSKVYETPACFLDPQNIASHQFLAPVIKGKNRLVVRVIGSHAGWSIRLSKPAPSAKYSKLLPAGNSPATKSVGRETMRVATRDYAETCLRLEHRPDPDVPGVTRRRARIMAEHGIEAHWIGIVDPTGSPYGSSKFLPPREGFNKEDERRLKEQVKAAHKNGITVMTWFPGSHCRSAAKKHPEWRTRYLSTSPSTEQANSEICCINSPFGKALTEFVCESIEKYDIDGFWFDGTLWALPGNIGCSCDYCRRLFEKEEGIQFPATADWNIPSFKRWVKWRYNSYIKFWSTLSSEVRRRFPNVRIVLNHPRRMPYWLFPGDYPIESWLCSMPADRYEGDVIIGSETVDTSFESAFHARLARAYGKQHSEVWTGLHWLSFTGMNWPDVFNPVNRYIHHAMACLTAGVMPSFGVPDDPEKYVHAFDLLHSLIAPRYKYIKGKQEKYAALHLSQQSETFYFSATKKPGFPHAYWKSLFGWHNLLCEKQLLLDIIFDNTFNIENLSDYPVVIAPLSICLSEKQLQDIREYVIDGGVLVTGNCFGSCDEWGKRTDRKEVRELLGGTFSSPPGPGEPPPDGNTARIKKLGKGKIIIFSGDPGYRFTVNRSRVLADEVGTILKDSVMPHITVKGPRRIHLGLFKNGSSLFLHVHNSIAWSESLRFPNQILTAPEPVKNVEVRIEGYQVSGARSILSSGSPSIRIKRSSGRTVEFLIPSVFWSEIIKIDT